MSTHVAAVLSAAERILLVTHEHPDGDALGTTLALLHGLEQLGKDVVATCVDEAPPPFQFLPGIERLQRDCLLGNFDLIVIIDCGDLKRTGMPHRIREFTRYRQRVLNIDHHQRNDLHKLASMNYVDYSASSAAELVFPVLEDLNVTFTPTVATCLLTGLYNDTGGFKHSNTTPKVLEQAAALMAAGGALEQINRNIANYKSVPALKLWGIALSRVTYHRELGVIVSAITEEDFAACDALPEDLAGCVNLLNCVPQAKATILLAELAGGRIKASVRTEHEAVDVGQLAAVFGGGGIRKAGGFSFSGHLHQDERGWRVIADAEPTPLRLSLRVAQQQLAIPLQTS